MNFPSLVLPDKKLTVLVSECLGFSPCRYNGAQLSSRLVNLLKTYVNFKTVCPEVAIGLGVPRPTLRLVNEGEKTLLWQGETEQDHSDAMKRFSNRFIEENHHAWDGAILKSKSPSCGLRDAKLYAQKSGAPPASRQSGFFADAMLGQGFAFPIESDGRLHNQEIRDTFLIRLFLLFKYKQLKIEKNVKKLREFHQENKLIFMSFQQEEAKELGRILANCHSEEAAVTFEKYEKSLVKVMNSPPHRGTQLNVLQHVLGYFKNHFKAPEKKLFLQQLDDFHSGKVPLRHCLFMLMPWVMHFEVEWLLGQTFFEPYPPELLYGGD